MFLLLQGVAGAVCSLAAAPFCCSKQLYFVPDESTASLRAEMRGRNRRRRGAAGAEDEDYEDEDDQGGAAVFFQDGDNVDLGILHDVGVAGDERMQVGMNFDNFDSGDHPGD